VKFVSDIRQPVEPYATPLAELTTGMEALAAKVAGHFTKMGCPP
jgi:hypothetical protein